MVFQRELRLHTHSSGQMHDLTGGVARIVSESGVRTGIVQIFNGNGHSHLQATLLGPSLTVPVRDGLPVLGTWQQIFHIECDVRPRERTVVVTVLGE